MPSTRFLASFAVGITIFAIGVLYTLSQPKVYEASGVIDFPGHLSRGNDGTIISLEEGLHVLRGAALATEVESRLSESERKDLLLPYQDMDIDESVSPVAVILLTNSEFSQIRHSRIISVRFKHQDPELAASVCNSYMRSFIDHWLRVSIDESMAQVEEKRMRADILKDRVEQAEIDLAEARDARQTAEPDKIEAHDIQIKELQEALEPLQKDFEAIIKEMTSEKAGSFLRQATARIIDPAMIPTKHVSPNIPIWITLSGILGLLTAWAAFVISKLLFKT